MGGGKRIQDYDLLVRISFCPNQGRALAWASPFVRHPDTERPITGIICISKFGDATFKKVRDSVNKGTGTLIHEFAHIISFSDFDKWHPKCLKKDNSIKRWKWTCGNVLKVARKHYGCNSLDGVPLSDENGKAGSHWSERFLVDELLTPITEDSVPDIVSPMTLALCEDTKWYKANYNYSENYVHGKGAGCNVFGKSCKSPQVCKIGTNNFITSDFMGIGYCKADDRGCAQELKYSTRNCNIATGWGASGIP